VSDSSQCSLVDPPVDLFGFVDFDVEGLDERVRAEAQGLAVHLLERFLGRLGDWIFSGGEGKPQGVMIRAHVAFWDVLPFLRRLKQTELAELMGLKHKQSVGREVSDFRDRFCWRNGHMQSEEARGVAREREARKKAPDSLKIED
jgi:hypothetical protein